MGKNVLIVAFHFPPMGGSSGVLRSLKFAKYLPDNGWTPTVLSAAPRVYDHLDSTGVDEIPQNVRVIRAFGLDAKKHLSINSKYPRFLANPDRWSSWYIGAVFAGLRVIRKHKIDVVFSTYPIATAHMIGHTLQWISGIPWIADFRDPMVEEGYPSDRATRLKYQQIEEKTVRNATRLIFTTGSTMLDLDGRYGGAFRSKSLVVSNGYDEADFSFLSGISIPTQGRQIRIVHGGLIYLQDRDPRPLFRAIRRLRVQGALKSSEVQFELRGSGADKELQSIIDEFAIDDIVKLLPSIPYKEFLADAATADGLLILQGESCDRQIPAKVYEYLRLRKPIFALTTDSSETAALLNHAGGSTIATIHEESDIYRALPDYTNALRTGTHTLPDREHIKRYSRSWQSRELANCLSEISNCDN